ncbi:LytTR family transcriptional regulator [Dolosigranulum pigrum]|uniref:LytTR family transcriptional regulator DNA-binding domain-containing protein n=1 Tax=Dolosigranulum pigrum TaxID=29394 RepID=UPI001BB7E826|nr:LytTR family transcriptional regulator [Dolosigranulum pigrum]
MPFFSLTIGSETIHVDFDQILSLQTSVFDLHKLVLTTTTTKYEFLGKLAECEANYSQFFRVSKSTLINPENVMLTDYKRAILLYQAPTLFNTPSAKEKLLKHVLRNNNK